MADPLPPEEAIKRTLKTRIGGGLSPGGALGPVTGSPEGGALGPVTAVPLPPEAQPPSELPGEAQPLTPKPYNTTPINTGGSIGGPAKPAVATRGRVNLGGAQTMVLDGGEGIHGEASGLVGPASGPAAAPAAPSPQPFDRTAFRDAWMATGSDVAAQDALLKQYGIVLDAAGRGNLPSGEKNMDLRFGAKAGINRAQWGAGGGASTTNTEGGGAGAGGGVVAAPGTDFQSQIRQMLLQRLQGLQGGPDLHSPEITEAMSGARLEQSRAQDQIRKALAERMAASGAGVQSGELGQSIQQSGERMGTQLAGLKGQLIQRAFQAQRAELQDTLQMAMQSGDAEAARALQLQLAQMDAELRRMGLSESARQWDDQFGWNVSEGMYRRDRDLVEYGGGD